MPLMGVIQLHQNWNIPILTKEVSQKLESNSCEIALVFDTEFASKQDIEDAEGKALLCFYMETLKTISML